MSINAINNVQILGNRKTSNNRNFIKQSQSDSVSFSSRIKTHRQREIEKARKQLIKGFLATGTAIGVIIGGAQACTKREAPNIENEETNIPIELPVEEEKPVVVEPIIVKPTAEKILEENPEVKEQYDKITQGLDTFSEHLGEDGLSLIKARVDELGQGKVEVLDVLKVLWIESNGKIYAEDGTILESVSGALGPFQIMPILEKDLNQRFDVNLNRENPYGNLDLCIYYLRFLNEKRSNDIENGKQLPTGDNLKHAIMWSYHDGAFANTMSYYGEDYIKKYDELSIVDKYPEVVEKILNG